MTASIHADATIDGVEHDHVFLGAGHERNERRTWFVIVLCGIMMVVEIVGGLAYGSIALVQMAPYVDSRRRVAACRDGLHLFASLCARRSLQFRHRQVRRPRRIHQRHRPPDDRVAYRLRIGDACIIPVQIHYNEALIIAVIGLFVNIASVWLLSGGHDHHGHGHSHGHSHGEDHVDAPQMIETPAGLAALTIFEDGVPPRFRLAASFPSSPLASDATIETVREDGARQIFQLEQRDGYLESREEIPEPHAFIATLRFADGAYEVSFDEHDHRDHGHHRDNNMRAAIVHVLADAAVSVLVIIGLLVAKTFGWLWMDPVAGVIGAIVITSWSYGLIRDTGAILLDMTPDRRLALRVRQTVEAVGDRVQDLHIWRLGPGHLGAIVSIASAPERDVAFYRSRLGNFPSISHLTVEITPVERSM